MGGKAVLKRQGIVSYNHSNNRNLKWLASLALVGVLLGSLVLVSFRENSLVVGRLHSPRGRAQFPASTVPNRSVSHSLKAVLKQCIRAIGDAPVLSPILYHAGIKRILQKLPGSRVLYGSEWDRKHPFDRAYGTDTSGFLFGEELLTGHPAEAHGSPYAGVQPSVLRTVLKAVPELETCTFIDLGCGKGRPMLIATEFPFRDIIGVELSPPLARMAQKNADLMARRFPERTRIRVETGDATAFPIPKGNVILFLYNSFDRELMLKVVDQVESALKEDAQRSIYVVYCNPASGDCFDASPLLTRRYARTHSYSREEQGYAPDKEDAVIIWQGGNAPAPTEHADAQIVVVKDRWRAELRA